MRNLLNDPVYYQRKGVQKSKNGVMEPLANYVLDFLFHKRHKGIEQKAVTPTGAAGCNSALSTNLSRCVVEGSALARIMP